MSSDFIELQKPIPIVVIGDGCAGLSLAAKADLLPEYALAIVAPRPEPPETDHIWGMWQMDWLKDVVPLARKKWQKWLIITAETKVLMQADTHPYHALTRQTWLAHCKQRAAQYGVTFHDGMSKLADLPAQQVFDSRPPKRRQNMMLQHFIGWQVRAASGSFDDSTAILMDFRCDQSRGMHFIYCLPFSDCEALVESTLISPRLEPDAFYETAISNWLTDCAGLMDFEITQTEKGAIPLGLMARHDPNLQGIGGNGGAIRPSSGYAFSFIQKQIARAVAQVANGGQLQFGRPHKTIDLWMDRVFLAVLRHQPEHAPEIFTKMATRLTGDEFALFLSGEADMTLRAKVVTAMPPLPFLRAALRPESGAP
ncbi:MAG: lycopene cyclase family protein [Paracoccaceae bacterium]|nr:lycopene cyclase family protein [Paracoccaceae bacterium]